MLSARAAVYLLAAIGSARLLSMVLVPLMDTSEPRYADIARMMAESGDWITPWFAPGVPFWGKPPLAFWASALSIKVFGLNEFNVRLPSFLAIAATCALVWRLGRHLYGVQGGRWAAVVFASMALALTSAGAVLMDPLLTLGITLSCVAFLLSAARPGQWWGYAFFVGLAVGLLSKGPLAVVIVLATLLTWSYRNTSSRAYWKGLPWHFGIGLTLTLTVPWYLAAEIKTPGFLNYFLIGEHALRFLQPGWTGDLYGTAHDRPYGSIWVDALLATFPWSLLIAPVGVSLFLSRGRDAARAFLKHDLNRFLLLWSASSLVLFTASGNILWTYVLPSLPPIAALVGGWIASANQPFLTRSAIGVSLLTPLAYVVLTAGAVALPERLKTEKSSVAQALSRMSSSDRLIYVNARPFSANFYSAGRAEVATLEQALAIRCVAPAQKFLAIERSELDQTLALLGSARTPIAESRGFALIQQPCPDGAAVQQGFLSSHPTDPSVRPAGDG